MAIGVLLVSSRADVGGGGENYLHQLARHLDRARFRPIVLLPGHGTLKPVLEALDTEVHVIESEVGWLKPPQAWYRFLAGLPERVAAVARLIREKDIRLVHTNSNQRFEGVLAAAITGAHHLYLAHIEFQPEIPLFQRFPLDRSSFAGIMAHLSSRVVAVSTEVAGTLSPQVPQGKIRVIPNGLDLETFARSRQDTSRSVRSELGLAETALLVAGVGRLAPDKGFEEFVEMARGCASRRPDVHFLLVGAPEQQDYAAGLRARVDELGLSGQVHFLGFRQDVPRILSETDVFLLSSRREGHPYVLLEAMACRCAVVATRCAGVTDTMLEGRTGLTVAIGDVEAMTAAVLRLLEDPPLRRSLGAQARVRVEAHFTAEASITRLMDEYDEVLRNPPADRRSIEADLFVRGAGEIGALGTRMMEIEKRLNDVHGLYDLMAANPVMRALRWLYRGIRRSG